MLMISLVKIPSGLMFLSFSDEFFITSHKCDLCWDDYPIAIQVAQPLMDQSMEGNLQEIMMNWCSFQKDFDGMIKAEADRWGLMKRSGGAFLYKWCSREAFYCDLHHMGMSQNWNIKAQ